MDIRKHIIKEERSLPVFLLLDVSGSMHGEKIEAVNIALKDMINSFKKIEDAKGAIKLCLITFGGNSVNIIKELSAIKDDDVYTLTANGNTPMASAFEMVSNLIEDYNVISSRDYSPTIVLISDGNPTDMREYRSGMTVEDILNIECVKKLHTGARTIKATKLAMGIGADQDINILKAFINNNSIPVIKYTDTSTIERFFNWVTMSISTRSVSNNPNQVSFDDVTDTFDDEEIEF